MRIIFVYENFSPPHNFATSDPKRWSGSEATEYCSWLTSAMDQRISNLLAYINEDDSRDSTELVEKSGKRVESILQTDYSFRECMEGDRLSSLGYAISADMGLLVAKCLMADSEGIVKWDVLRKPRSAQSYNLPVLVGFRSKVFLDPLAASIAQGSGVRRDPRKRIDGSICTDTGLHRSPGGRLHA